MKFYIIEEEPSLKFARAEKAEPIIRGEPEYCHACGAPLTLLSWLPPHKVILDKAVFGDFVFGAPSSILVSKRFKEAYSTSPLKGILAFHPVEIVKVKQRPKKSTNMPDYFKIDIVRTRTHIDEILSRFEREFTGEAFVCPVCRRGGNLKSYKGVYMKEDTWTGEDIFYAVGLNEIIVTERFVYFAGKLLLTNIKFISANEYVPYWLRFQQ